MEVQQTPYYTGVEAGASYYLPEREYKKSAQARALGAVALHQAPPTEAIEIPENIILGDD